MHNFGQETGGDDNSRITEAKRIVELLQPRLHAITPREREFVMQMDGASHCSGKQLFWLRDIKDKYL